MSELFFVLKQCYSQAVRRLFWLLSGWFIFSPVTWAFSVDGFVMPTYVMKVPLSNEEYAVSGIDVEFARASRGFALDLRYNMTPSAQWGATFKLFRPLVQANWGAVFVGAGVGAMTNRGLQAASPTWQSELRAFSRYMYEIVEGGGVSFEVGYDFVPFVKPTEGANTSLKSGLSRFSWGLGIFIDI